MLELAQTAAPTASQDVLDVNRQALLKAAKDTPVAALKDLKQKWDTLRQLMQKEGASKDLLGRADEAYRKFDMFYTGVTTVSESMDELKAGKMHRLLTTYVADYYDLKKEHQAHIKPKPTPYEPTPPSPEKTTNLLAVGVIGVAALGLYWWMLSRR